MAVSRNFSSGLVRQFVRPTASSGVPAASRSFVSRSSAHTSRVLRPANSLNLHQSAAAHYAPISFGTVHPQASSLPSQPQYSIPSFPCNKSAVARISASQTTNGNERSFFISDVGVVERQYNRWLSEVPNVRPFYAVKCNPDETILKVLSGLGSGFDVASAAEMAAALAMGVSAEDIIFANPIKSISDLRYAESVGVNKMTFDNEAELVKIAAHHPKAQCVLRLLPDDSGSVMRFGVKFGAPQSHVVPLLLTAKRLNLSVIGTSFHIGSGCFDPESYAKAIALCRSVFDIAPSLGLEPFKLLDIGGGFPGNPNPHQPNGSVPAFESFTEVIRKSLIEHFGPTSPHSSVEVIAEPGRYMATAYSTLFTFIQGKREEPRDPAMPNAPKKFLYYINDGVYGSFNCIMFDHAHPVPVPMYRFMNDVKSLERKDSTSRQFISPIPLNFGILGGLNGASESKYANARALHSKSGRVEQCLSTFFGPTCDSMDVIAKDSLMEELFVGDWLAFEHMGAYTNAAATTFNGMPKPNIFYARSKNQSPSN